MSLSAPNLDDRTFQDLVNEAKRIVQQRCPEWTDHNVSDPGVTLIETFAYLVDQLIYRLNRVPHRHYVKFLELLGLGLRPPTAAQGPVTFWLGARATETIVVPPGTVVATSRASGAEPVLFSTADRLDIVPCAYATALSQLVGESGVRLHEQRLLGRQQVPIFSDTPIEGDALYVALSNAVPSCAVTIRMSCQVEGVGVNPNRPPLLWEAWDGTAFVPCQVERDETLAFNRDGDVVLHIPASHTASNIQGVSGGWVRCRVVPNPVSAYSKSPTVQAIEAFTIGGTTLAMNAEKVHGEAVGVSNGLPGQRFGVASFPLVPTRHDVEVTVTEDGVAVPWTVVANFADSTPDDRHVVMDFVAGEITFGPAVREPDGSFRHWGKVPPREARVFATYLHGGGRAGNVAAGQVTQVKTTVPGVDRVENREAMYGGVDAESLESAIARGPILLRTRNRAVTAEDYEVLAMEAAPELARVRCIDPSARVAGPSPDLPTSGAARVLIVPQAPQLDGRIEFGDLVPTRDAVDRIVAYLERRRTIGVRVTVEPPQYIVLRVSARVQPRVGVDPAAVVAAATTALYRYFNPLTGGPDGDGWPFGRPAHVGEVYSVLHAVRGVELVDEATFRVVNPMARGDDDDQAEVRQRVEVRANQLVFSARHHVEITR